MRLFFALLISFAFIFLLIVPKVVKTAPKIKLGIDQSKGELPKLYAYPVKNKDTQTAPEISAKSAIIIDAKTGIVLYEKDPDIRHLPASTTKLMTALVALERCQPQTELTVNKVVPNGTQMGLAVGDRVTVETLLYGMLVNSGNDAAYALAYGCADSFEQFMLSVNERVKELGMQNTHFTNPAGFDDPYHYSTARDLAKLAKVAVANPEIAKIVATKSIVRTDTLGQKTYYLENVNKLLGEVEGLEGVKTGQTEGSLEILVSKITRKQNTIIVAVLSSYDRFGETKNLIEWTFANHTWQNP